MTKLLFRIGLTDLESAFTDRLSVGDVRERPPRRVAVNTRPLKANHHALQRVLRRSHAEVSRGVSAMTKLRNQLRAIDPTLTVKLTNTQITGRLVGCSGFVGPSAGHWVYINTESRAGCGDNLYRQASHDRDFSRGSAPNNFAGNEDLARAVVALITATAGHAAAVKPIAQQPLHHNESAPS